MKVVLYLIYAFAQNGMTSAEMLQRTYLRFIEEEATAKGHGHRFAQVIVRWSSGLNYTQPKSQLAHLSLCRLVTYDFERPGQRKTNRRLTELDIVDPIAYNPQAVLNIIHYAIFIIFTNS